ncbi:MAG: hypothetical protein ACTS2F_20435 [Thainema sp.]
MTYTTQRLIEILDQELRANWRGERVLLSSDERINNPVIAKAIGTNKLSKVFAYQDFRAQVHEYQREHSVSGIVWRDCRYGNHTLRIPEIHNQLIAIPGDKEILMQSKAAALEFWWAVTQGMKFWLADMEPKPIAVEQVHYLIANTEWAELDIARTDLYLGLCWGSPKDYRYQWAKPDSGCDRIIAAMTEPSAIKV